MIILENNCNLVIPRIRVGRTANRHGQTWTIHDGPKGGRCIFILICQIIYVTMDFTFLFSAFFFKLISISSAGEIPIGNIYCFLQSVLESVSGLDELSNDRTVVRSFGTSNKFFFRLQYRFSGLIDYNKSYSLITDKVPFENWVEFQKMGRPGPLNSCFY